MPLYLIILAIVVMYILGRFKFSAILRLKPLLLPAVCALFIGALMIFSKTALGSALNGLKLWLQIVLPSVFPFLVASQLVIKSGSIKIFGALLEPLMRPLFNLPGEASLALAMGLTCGYPVGAKVTSELREKRYLTQNEANRLLAFSNNASPLFITGAVGTALFGSSSAGLLLLGGQIAAGLSVGIVSGIISRKKYPAITNTQDRSNKGKLRAPVSAASAGSGKNVSAGFSILLGNAVIDSLNTMLMVGGFIILFSVIIGLLTDTGLIAGICGLFESLLKQPGMNTGFLESILSGFLEIVTGLSKLSTVEGLSPALIMSAVGLILGWSGLSVHFQVMSVISKTDLKAKSYLFGKLMQSILAAVYSYIFASLFPSAAAFGQTKTVFSFIENSHDFSYIFITDVLKWLSVAFILIVLLSLLISQFRREKRSSRAV